MMSAEQYAKIAETVDIPCNGHPQIDATTIADARRVIAAAIRSAAPQGAQFVEGYFSDQYGVGYRGPISPGAPQGADMQEALDNLHDVAFENGWNTAVEECAKIAEQVAAEYLLFAPQRHSAIACAIRIRASRSSTGSDK